MSLKPTEVRGEAGVYIGGGEDQSQQGDAGAEQELGAASWSLVTPGLDIGHSVSIAACDTSIN